MIFFNNAKFLLLFVCFSGGFQQIQSFWCCNDDATVDTRLKPDQTNNKSNFSLKAAIDQNKKNYEWIISSQALNQENASTQSDITSSKNRSDLATAMIKHDKDKKKSSQDNSLNSQTSVAQFDRTASPHDIPTTTQQISASADQPYTETYLFESLNQKFISIPVQEAPHSNNGSNNQISLPIRNDKAFSSEQTYIQSGDNIALGQEKSGTINSHMPKLILPPAAIPLQDTTNMAQNNSFVSSHESNENIVNDEFQNNNFGVIQLQAASGQQSPNHAFKGRRLSSQELPLFIMSPKESTDLQNNNLPNAIPESFNQNNDN